MGISLAWREGKLTLHHHLLFLHGCEDRETKEQLQMPLEQQALQPDLSSDGVHGIAFCKPSGVLTDPYSGRR